MRSLPKWAGRTGVSWAVRSWWREIEPLWVGGLALLCLLVGHLIFTRAWLESGGKAYDWGQYLMLGIVFPALLVGVSILPRLGRFASRLAAWLRGGLVVLLIAGAGLFVLVEGELLLAMVALAQVLLMAILSRRAEGAWRPAMIGASLVVSVIAWTMAIRLLWWPALSESPYARSLLASPYRIAVFVLVLVLVCFYLSAPRGEARRVRLWSPANLVAFLLIGLVSLRTDGLFTYLDELGPLHHWGIYVGTAELVRQGGWLYWDVPSQYGFLSILTLAFFPTNTAWQALYVLQAAFMFLVGVALFLVLRTLRPGIVSWCVSLATTLATVFFAVSCACWLDDSSSLATHHLYPSPGPYRFIWCYMLLTILVWEFRTDERSPAHGRILATGCVVWLLSMLWAPEVGFYASVIWLPAYILIVLRKTMVRDAAGYWPGTGLRRAVVWLTLPPLLLTAAVGTVVAYYLVRLGRAPDPMAYIDYLVSFGQGTGLEAVNWQGPVLALVLGLCMLGTAAVYTLRSGSSPRALSLFVGIWGMVWGTHTLTIGAYFPFKFLQISSLLCFALGLTLHLLPRRSDVHMGRWDHLFRVSTVPILTMLLVITAFDPRLVAGYVERSYPQHIGDIEQLLPTVDQSLIDLFEVAGVRPDDPIMYTGSEYGNLLRAWPVGDGDDRVVVTRAWLPAPYALFFVLPEERSRVYISRFVDRTRLSGWLIQRKEEGRIVPSSANVRFSPGLWFFDQLRQTHTPTKVFENDDWQLVWFEYEGVDTDGRRPTYPEGKLETLPPDIFVDGQSPGRGTNTGIWALYGEGWYQSESTGDDRWASSPAQLYVYSPEARQVELQLAPLATVAEAATGRSTLLIATNDAATHEQSMRAGQPLSVDIGLRAGWNQVTLALTEGNLRWSDIDPSVTDDRPFSFQFESLDIVTR